MANFQYAAPEQRKKGGVAIPQTDIYAVAPVSYTHLYMIKHIIYQSAKNWMKRNICFYICLITQMNALLIR